MSWADEYITQIEDGRAPTVKPVDKLDQAWDRVTKFG